MESRGECGVGARVIDDFRRLASTGPIVRRAGDEKGDILVITRTGIVERMTPVQGATSGVDPT